MTGFRDTFFRPSHPTPGVNAVTRRDQGATSLPRPGVVSLDHRHCGKSIAIRRNPTPRQGPSSSIRKRALRTGAASTPGHNRRTTLSSVPKAGACSPVWPTPLGTEGSTAVGPDPLKTPTSSAQQTPPRDADTHDHNCARSDSLGFSGY